MGIILIKEGYGTAIRLEKVAKNRPFSAGRVGRNLIEMRGLSEEQLAQALGKRHGRHYMFGEVPLAPDALALLNRELVDRYDVIPYGVKGKRLMLLAIDPGNLVMLDEVSFVTGKIVEPIVVP